MNPAGVVLAIAGAWVVSQVFAGNALERLNILKPRPAGDGGVLPPGVGPGLAPYIPGGDKNPAVPTFPDIFGGGIGGKYL
jgi:hypothetical protein